jgi:hypothetical protein
MMARLVAIVAVAGQIGGTQRTGTCRRDTTTNTPTAGVAVAAAQGRSNAASMMEEKKATIYSTESIWVEIQQLQ